MTGLAFTQGYWLKLTQLLMSRRKLCIVTTDRKVSPFERFKEFLHYLACKNTKRVNEDDYMLGHQQ